MIVNKFKDYIDCRAKKCKYQSSTEETFDGENHCELTEIVIEVDAETGLPICKCFTEVP